MSIVFKEWLPDLSALDNPGVVRAQNVLPTDGTYKSMKTMTVGASNGTTPSAPIGGIVFPSTNALPFAASSKFMIGTTSLLLRSHTSSGLSTIGSGYSTPSGGYWRFTRFDDQILATNNSDLPQRSSAGTSSAVVLGSSSGTAPSAQQIGVINRFVFLGDLNTTANSTTDNYSIQWSGIDQPTSWPAENTATATAQQAGFQIMPSDGGTVTGISSGDQYGLIFQRNRISRATYVGPPVVFQFDTIDTSHGCFFPNSLVQVGNRTYFCAAFGFFMTDGVTTVPISDNKVSNFFLSSSNYLGSTGVYGAVDYETQCIYWTNEVIGGMAIYNYIENRWAYTTETSTFIMSGVAPV